MLRFLKCPNVSQIIFSFQIICQKKSKPYISKSFISFVNQPLIIEKSSSLA